MRIVVLALALFLVLSGCMERSAPATGPTETTSNRIQSTRSSGGDATGPLVEVNRTAPDFGNISRLWGMQTERVVMDAGYKWHDDANLALAAFDQASQVVANPCAWKPQEVYFNNRPVSFDNRTQTVWPGTGKIEVTLTWTLQDSHVEELVLAYRANSTADYNQTPFIKKGQPFAFDVAPPEWDHGADARTTWDFAVCVTDDAWNTNGSREGRFFYGSFHIKMRLLRGEYPVDSTV